MSNPNKPRTIVLSRDLTVPEAERLCDVLNEVLASDELAHADRMMLSEILALHRDAIDSEADHAAVLEDAMADGYNPDTGRYDG